MAQAKKYEKVYIDRDKLVGEIGTGTRAKHPILVDAKDSSFLGEPVITGYEVAKDGTRTDTIHIIPLEVIKKRVPMVMNQKYCELEKED